MTDDPKSTRKAQIDALLLKLPGVTARKLNGLDAYFVSDRMFACISGDGIGLRLPATVATELQFSRNNVVTFAPLSESKSGVFGPRDIAMALTSCGSVNCASPGWSETRFSWT